MSIERARLAAHEDAPSEDGVRALHVDALRERAKPLVQVLGRHALAEHVRAVRVDLRDHFFKVGCEVPREVDEGDVGEAGGGEHRAVLGRPRHPGRRVPVGEVFERLLVRAVRAHDVRERESAARLEAREELGEQRGLGGRVAEHLARDDVAESAGPLARQPEVEVEQPHLVARTDAERVRLGLVHRVLRGRDVGADDARGVEAGEELVGETAVSRAQV
mmetsp:Transcript_9381/g.29610  ORF Transcript_9381/g.29610 Transcript_9381/m.29610 type:complete len:219 (+) Transcript_9381:874-1530(+)